jgi:hypothetical protein
MLIESPILRARDSLFDESASGSIRFLSRGFATQIVTNVANGNSLSFQGGYRVTSLVAADGSLRVDASGTGFVAWYLEGDNSELGPGLFHVSGHVTEWYDSDGTLIRATFRGTATNLCEALAG